MRLIGKVEYQHKSSFFLVFLIDSEHNRNLQLQGGRIDHA